MRTGPETYERKSDADRALVMIEAQIRSGEWTDPERGKVKLGDYALAWITERPGLRPRTMDLYRWLLRKHIEPYLGGVPVGKLSTRQIREWRQPPGRRRHRLGGGQGIPADPRHHDDRSRRRQAPPATRAGSAAPGPRAQPNDRS